MLLVAPRDSSFRGFLIPNVKLDLIQSRERYTRMQEERADRVELVDLDDLESVLTAARSLHSAIPLRGVAAFHEHYLELAAQVAADLGVRGTDGRVVANVKDKSLTRNLSYGSGLAQPKFATVDSAELIRSALDEVGLPAVVKPLTGAGSANIRAVHAEEEVASVQAEMETAGGTWIVEQYLDGSEYSIESFTEDGVTRIRAITEKLVDEVTFVELGHQMPARLSPVLSRRITDGVTGLLAAVGMDVGPAHTEVRVVGGEPYLIETHARYGGDRIWEMTGMVTGYYPQAEMIASLAGVEPVPASVESQAVAVRFVTANPGTVESIEGIQQARSIPGVVAVAIDVEPNSLVTSLRSSDDRLGYVLASGDDTEHAAIAAEAAAASIRVQVREVTL